MKVTPTSGPIATSNTHHARDAISSRYSFATSQRKEKTAEGAENAETNDRSALFAFSPVFSGSLCERKEHLFEVARRARTARGGERSELVERAFAADPSAAQQHEAIAHPRRVVDLMNRQEHRPAG